MKQQTAVEWLIEKIATKDNSYQAMIFYIDHEKEIKEAKQMEKDQQFGFFVAGIDATEEGGKDFEQYYSNTFKIN